MNTSSDQLFHPYKCGELILDFEKHTLTISGNIVHLTPISFQITYTNNKTLELPKLIGLEGSFYVCSILKSCLFNWD